ncbi:HEAT repeat domain-containing protein [Actinoplanes sp. L3-i22]|uniref:HEAT repeat domain-containing protein n=1 Tax=Actinoplanes sp. L3-i22 TaxID=2836373 RepID=UPI001C859BA2|nr:HEAT repeat domain-containing protein [Actinoplanes sp. L3-i22]
MMETELPRTGVHDVDWSLVEDGSAVRQMLSNLAGGDAAARTTALRSLYRIAPDGADVRPWVAAALPVLLGLVEEPEQADRGRILRLVGDLAGADRMWQMSGETLRAKRILAEHDHLLALLTDEDPEVRDAAAYTVRAVCRLSSELVELLWERYIEEPDPGVRLTLVGSGVLAGAVGTGWEPTKRLLAWVADTDADLRVRTTALAELMALTNPPPFDVETARDTVLEAYREGLNREPARLDDLVAPLLAGQWLAARQWTPGYPQVVSAVRGAFRNDVAPQLDLLERMLELDGWDARQDALYEARSLVQRFRGPYGPLVDRAAELVRDQDSQVRAAALSLLCGIGELARPAADAVWANLSRGGFWINDGAHGPMLTPTVRLLADLRDVRLLPTLERMLDEAPDTGDLHPAIAGYGIAARGLSRTLRRLLRALDPAGAADRAGLLRALAAVAPHEAADHLADDPIDLDTLALLARAGRAAAGRAPDIRAALSCGDPGLELAAAYAIWHVTGNADAAAEVYDRYFDDRRAAPEHAVAALDGLRELRIRVKDRARRLVRLRRRQANPAVLAATADALWWVAGNQDAARAIGPVWEAAAPERPRIARLWLATGDVRYGARYARAELDNPLRHNLRGHSVRPAEVSADERLLTLCREVLAQAG